MYKQFTTMLCIAWFCITCNSPSPAPSDKNNDTSDADTETPTDTIEAAQSLSIETLSAWIQSDTALFHAGIGIAFYKFDGTMLVGYNTQQSLIPASCTKLLTTAAALEILKPETRFNTQIMHDGEIKGRTLKGNIVIVGSGDPMLGAEAFSNHYKNFPQQWADAVRALGIDSIEGKIIADERIFGFQNIPPTWSWGEIGDYYAAGASGINVYENKFELQYNFSLKGVVKASTLNMKPYIPYLQMTNESAAGNIFKEELYFEGDPYGSRRIIRGLYPSSNANQAIEGAIPEPAFFAAFVLDSLLRQSKVVVKEAPASLRQLYFSFDTAYKSLVAKKRTKITNTLSPTVLDAVNYANTHSQNLFAEALLKQIGVKQYNLGTTGQGLRGVADMLDTMQINTQGMNINDGSGVSRYNIMTTKQMIDLLLYMNNKSPYSKQYKQSLAVAAQTGTMRFFGKNTVLEGKVRAKTGSMSKVLCYAGYVETLKNNEYAFVLFANNYTGEQKYMKQRFEQIMLMIVNNH